ncbi:MAG TPA: class I SAM-dependent methyltransferase [Crocinitomicaceae bacterium]|nr:class I SAM-dependent methyltransferase [Crocinitomicaceae bacterium]
MNLKKGFYYLKKAVYYVINRPIIIHEKAFDKLYANVPGWLEKGHLYCMNHAITNLPDDKSVILEIGTYHGLSTNAMLYFKSKNNIPNPVVTVDLYSRITDPNEKIVNLESPYQINQFIKESFVRNVRFFNPQATIQSSDLSSDDFFKAWDDKQAITNLFGGEFVPEGTIAFAYVDGNHDYDFVKRDFENIDKYLVNGGFILFDDSAGYTNFDPKLVAQEVVKSGRYKVIRKNPHYFIQKIK